MIDVKKIFCQRLTALREKAGLSQAELAEMFSKTQATISRWESGTREPSLTDIYHLSHVLGCSIDQLFDVNTKTSDFPGWLMPLLPDLAKLKAAGREAVKVVIRGYKKDDD